jgi:YYY domain-containing protein
MPLRSLIALGAGSLALFAPFYLHFRSLSHGIGTVTTPTDPYEFLQVLGFPVLVCALLVGSLNLLLRPAEEETETEAPTREGLAASLTKGGEAGSATLALLLALAGVVLLGGVLHRWALLLLLAFGLWTAMVLVRVISTEQPNLSDAAGLVWIGVAALLLVITELYYVRDSFDGSGLYRMNTVFKLYYHAWVLLGLAGAYGVYRAWNVLSHFFGRSYAWAAMAVAVAGALGAGVATRYVPSYVVDSAVSGSLDGMVWLKRSQPGDYAAIQWMRSNVKGNPVQLEAEGPDYLVQGPYGRVSAFTGLPTVMGWAGHEVQWRPGNPEIGTRQHDVCALYTTNNLGTAEQLLHKYNVRYVFVGTQERQPCENRPPSLTKFGRLMHIAYRSGSTIVYTW